MQLSKPLLIVIVLFTALISGTLGYLVQTLDVNQAKAELNQEINGLQGEIDRLRIQLEAAGVPVEPESGSDNQPPQNGS